MFRTTATLSTLALAAACATPNPPTVSATDVTRAYVQAAEIRDLPFTSTQDLPTGSVNYQGKLGADVSGDANGSILGDLSMDVNFGTNNVTGDVTNINLIDTAGRPDQRFGGQLDIEGAESGGRIDGFAFGDLEAVTSNGSAVETNVLLTLDGDIYSDIGDGDAVFGSARGDAIGEIDFNIDGVFFGTAD